MSEAPNKKEQKQENAHAWAKGKEKKSTKNPGEKKAAKTVALVVVIATAVLLLLTWVSSLDLSPVIDAIFPEKKTERKIKFYYADFDEDIMQDEEYLGMTRLMAYTEGAQTALLNESDYPAMNPFIRFMHDYFNLIIAGDSEGYNACFSDDYYETNKKEHKKKEAFTMQRLYEPSLTYIRTETENPNKANERTHVFYLVSYKIQKNNGTFRDDMGSDCSKEEVYELVQDLATGKILIENIGKNL